MRNFFTVFAVIAPLAAHAVVATTSRTAPMARDSAWSGVGQMSGASAVAIGPHTVLTAAHVAAGDFSLDGVTYHATSTEIAPTIKKSAVDLRIVHLAETLPTWYSVATTVKKGAAVTMVGFGGTGVLEEDGAGYDLASGSGRHSGTNTISKLTSIKGNGPVMKAMLDYAGEAVLAPGDSGGGWFANGQLVGISDFTFSTSTSKDDYGFAKKAYFGSGAVDVTNKTIRRWLNGEIEGSGTTTFAVAGGVQAVPEPGSCAALALGAGVLLRRKKR